MLFLLITCFTFITFLCKSLSLKPLPLWSSSEVRLLSIWFWNDFLILNPFKKEFLESFMSSNMMTLRRRGFSSRVENVEANSEMSMLDLPELVLECILERLPPEGLCSMASVCSSLREKCTSKYLWEKHVKEKWGRVLGPAAHREWLWHISSRNDSSFFNQAKERGLMTYISQFWPISLVRSNSSTSFKKNVSPAIDSIMSMYLALESGKFWFPAQVYNRGNNWPHDNNSDPDQTSQHHHNSKSSIRVAIILASVGAALMIGVVLLAYHRERFQDFHLPSGFNGQSAGRDVKLGRFSRPAIFKFHGSSEPPPTSLSFSNDHLLTANSRSLSGQIESGTEIVEHVFPEGVAAVSASTHLGTVGNHPATSGRRSSPGSPAASSPRFIDTVEQPVTLDVYSPDRLAGELFFLDGSLSFTAEELSRAPAEVLGRSSHGTLYKATLNSGHVLTVKWLRVGLVKNKKEFAKEVRKIGSIRHPNAVPLRAYYWGPREQERLILADYIPGDSLALHLYETTPRRYSPLSFNQRLKAAVEVARGLGFLHERGLPHGNLKPTNIILVGADYSARLTDYGLHRLMTPAGIAEQILNLGALGYRAPELATATKPIPSFKADVYALGVILMELLTRRSAGDIISGHSGAVDLTDWVRLCDQEGRGMDCIDRDIAGGEEHCKAMDDLLAVSLRCILPVNERPNIRQVVEDLGSISV